MSDEGCAVLARSCRKLQMFALSRTEFSDVGAQAVATHCRDLKVLGINTSAFTDEGYFRCVEGSDKPYAGFILMYLFVREFVQGNAYLITAQDNISRFRF